MKDLETRKSESFWNRMRATCLPKPSLASRTAAFRSRDNAPVGRPAKVVVRTAHSQLVAVFTGQSAFQAIDVCRCRERLGWGGRWESNGKPSRNYKERMDTTGRIIPIWYGLDYEVTLI